MIDSTQWRVPAQPSLPDWLLSTVRQFLAPSAEPNQGIYAAQLLWQRGLRHQDDLLRFLDPQHYQPADPLVFGPEMERAVARLQQAFQAQEKVTIWGDIHPDGLTAAAVLWDGLHEFLDRQSLEVWSNRAVGHDGLTPQLTQLAEHGCKILIVCNPGPIDAAALHVAQTAGLDVMVIDAYRSSVPRLPVVAQLMPRTLSAEHPFRLLASVAVAYKLVEALYEKLPAVPKRPLARLLDLVAIGLLADRVQLTGEGRYLAQQGITALKRNQDPVDPPRPGIAKLLELCRRSGDRPTDITFGLAPRIQAVSQLQQDAQNGLELLTSQNRDRCDQLAREAELAHARRRALQRTVAQQVRERLATLDLSTTAVIVLADSGWPFGILSFVASQISQEYARPTLLLTIDSELESLPMARGVARSAQPLDFAALLHQQAHLLDRVSGHPQAVALSLPAENLPLLTEALNQQLRLHPSAPHPDRQADLTVTVAELGQSLFQELNLLEPCGIGNPVPWLLIQNCWFTRTWHRKIQDLTGSKLEYLKTEFELRDDSCAEGFPGVWWGHYKDELPVGRCDVIVELDFNSYEDARRSRRYEIRLIAVRPHQAGLNEAAPLQLLDHRGETGAAIPAGALVVHHCPRSWAEFQRWCQQADQMQRPLVLAYALSAVSVDPLGCWQQFIELAQVLSQTQQQITADELQQRFGLGQQSLSLGLQALSAKGFRITALPQGWQISGQLEAEAKAEVAAFLQAFQEEQFMQQYFRQAPLAVLQMAVNRMLQVAS